MCSALQYSYILTHLYSLVFVYLMMAEYELEHVGSKVI